MPRPLRGDVGVVGDECIPKAGARCATSGADAAKSDDAERLAMKLDALPLRALPAAGNEGGVGLWDVAGLGQEQREGLLGRREDVRLRGVDDHDAALRSPRDVDVVEADAGPTDDDEVGAGGQHVGGHLRRRADDQGVLPRGPPPAARRA